MDQSNSYVEIIDIFFRKMNLFLVEQKYCIMGLCIFKYSFNIWQDCDFFLVRLTQLSKWSFYICQNKLLLCTRLFTIAFHLNQSKSHSFLIAYEAFDSLPFFPSLILSHSPIHWSSDLLREISSYLRTSNLLFCSFCMIHFYTSLRLLLKCHLIIELCCLPYIAEEILHLGSFIYLFFHLL